MKQIPLGGGKFASVDDEDFEFLSQFKWHYSNTGYPTTTITLHRFIKPSKAGMVIDHINRDKLDCQKRNLRACTKSQNAQNMARHRRCRSGYKGVIPNFNNRTKQPCSWRAAISKDGQDYRLGTTKRQHESALLYDFWATLMFGEFAATNFTFVSSSEKPLGGSNGPIPSTQNNSPADSSICTRCGYPTVQKANRQV